MAIDELSAIAAAEMLESDPEAVYLDVRTVREFDQGHAVGAYNVPVVFLEPGRPGQPNAEFGAIVEKHFTKDRRLIIGCQSGVRSMKACHILAEAGYTRLANIEGGFGSARDRSGQVLAIGWSEAGLPVTTEAAEGRAYDDLKS
jgi:rhodanese-related sulfurtransferase